MALVMEVRIPSCCANKVMLFAKYQSTAPELCIPWLVTAGLWWYFVMMSEDSPKDMDTLCDKLSDILEPEMERVLMAD